MSIWTESSNLIPFVLVMAIFIPRDSSVPVEVPVLRECQVLKKVATAWHILGMILASIGIYFGFHSFSRWKQLLQKHWSGNPSKLWMRKFLVGCTLWDTPILFREPWLAWIFSHSAPYKSRLEMVVQSVFSMHKIQECWKITLVQNSPSQILTEVDPSGMQLNYQKRGNSAAKKVVNHQVATLFPTKHQTLQPNSTPPQKKNLGFPMSKIYAANSSKLNMTQTDPSVSNQPTALQPE